MPGPSPSCCPLRCDRSRSAAGRSPASASFAWGRSVRTGHRAGLACAARTPPIASPSSGTARRGQKPGSIPRRDSGSAVNVLAGGRLFPGRHHHASFDVHETPRDLHVAYTSRDGATSVQVDVSLAEQFQGSELFADLHEASAFFRHGSSGYSAGRDRGHLDGMELHTDSWRVQPVEAHVVRSTFFDESGVSLWAEMAAPLIAGTNLRTASAATMSTLLNQNVIAVDQDPLGKQGTEVSSSGGLDVLAKPLQGGAVAVVLFNENNSAATISTTAAAVGLPAAASYTLSDLWANTTTSTAGPISANVPANAVVMYRVTPAGVASTPTPTPSPTPTDHSFSEILIQIIIPFRNPN